MVGCGKAFSNAGKGFGARRTPFSYNPYFFRKSPIFGTLSKTYKRLNMKKQMPLLFLMFGLLLAAVNSRSQSLPVAPADTLFVLPLAVDTLPTITMETDGGLVLLAFIAPVGLFYLDTHFYQVGKEHRLSPNFIKPYLLRSADPEILQNHRKFSENRKIWRVATSAGIVMWAIGIVQSVNSIFDSGSAGGAGTLLLMGTAGTMGGQVARLVSFRSLRRAIDLYNYQYAGEKPTVSLHLGLPSSAPAGLGLYVKF